MKGVRSFERASVSNRSAGTSPSHVNRNPSNYFAETEQVAFHTGHLVPDIEVTNDPLMQARLFYKLACDGGEMLGCSNLGFVYYGTGRFDEAAPMIINALKTGFIEGDGKYDDDADNDRDAGRTDGRHNKAPVIILTSQSSPFDRARGALAGCDIYLTKPVGVKQFYAATTKALRKSMAVDDLSEWLTDPSVAAPAAHA